MDRTQPGRTSPLPFHLVDDDTKPYPYEVTLDLLQGVDDPTSNILAQAYIRPLDDLAGLNLRPEPAFARNVEATEQPFQDQLQRGRDVESTEKYWVAYLQGGFQGDKKEDRDPTSEAILPHTVAFGTTLSSTAGGKFLGADGAIIFDETIMDRALASPSVDYAACLARTVAHEMGHHMAGLADRSGGIMTDGCGPPLFFEAQHLAAIRTTEHP